MAWCHQTTSHYLKQSWPRSVSPCGMTRPQGISPMNNITTNKVCIFHGIYWKCNVSLLCLYMLLLRVVFQTLGLASEKSLMILNVSELYNLVPLTHWPLRHGVAVFKHRLKVNEHSLLNCSQVNATEHLGGYVNNGSGNGLVPSGNKPLPEPLSPQICFGIWCL